MLPRFEYLSETEKQFVHEQTMRLLEEVGVAYNTPTLTGLLKDAGATVDESRLQVKLPWDLVDRCLRQVPREILLAGREPAYDCTVGGGRMLYTSDGAATYMLDDLTGERHEGTEADLAAMMTLYDAVPEIDFTVGDHHARRRRLPRRQPGDGADLLRALAQAPAGRGAHARTRRR